jgi:16S rRNA processing protein RimM
VATASSKKHTPLRKPPIKEGYYCVGVIFDAHGIKGEVKVKPFTEDALLLNQHKAPLTADGQTLTIKKARVGTRGTILDLAEISNRNDAENLVGTYLYLPNDTLPEASEDEISYAQLMDMLVVLENGDKFGTVSHAFDSGAHTVLVINHNSGEEIMVPFVEQYILEIHPNDGKLVVSADAEQFVGL